MKKINKFCNNSKCNLETRYLIRERNHERTETEASFDEIHSENIILRRRKKDVVCEKIKINSENENINRKIYRNNFHISFITFFFSFLALRRNMGEWASEKKWNNVFLVTMCWFGCRWICVIFNSKKYKTFAIVLSSLKYEKCWQFSIDFIWDIFPLSTAQLSFDIIL